MKTNWNIKSNDEMDKIRQLAESQFPKIVDMKNWKIYLLFLKGWEMKLV